MEQILTDLTDDLLGDHDHDLRIAIGREHAARVNASSKRHRADQACHVAGNDILIDDRFEHICAKQIGQGAERDEHGHDQQQKLMIAHVMKQSAKRLPEIVGTPADRLSHCRSPLSAAIHTIPDIPGCWPAARCACPAPRCARHPE